MKALSERFRAVFGFSPNLKDLPEVAEDLVQDLQNQVLAFYRHKEQEIGSELLRYLEKMFLLQTIDVLWKDHLLTMDHLRESVGLRGYGQKDPLQEYKREAYELFEDLLARIREQTLAYLFRVQVVQEEVVQRMEEERRYRRMRLRYSRGEEKEGVEEERPRQKPIRRRKIGRNDPCPCGSGKKYKKCCGRKEAVVA